MIFNTRIAMPDCLLWTIKAQSRLPTATVLWLSFLLALANYQSFSPGGGRRLNNLLCPFEITGISSLAHREPHALLSSANRAMFISTQRWGLHLREVCTPHITPAVACLKVETTCQSPFQLGHGCAAFLKWGWSAILSKSAQKSRIWIQRQWGCNHMGSGI